MRTRQVDVAVIGAGSAGLTARREAQRQGARTVLIEGGPLGTTCARVGCMPSKLLIAPADAAYHVRRAKMFGVHAEPRIDGAEVMQRVQQERDRFVSFVVRDVEALPEDAVIRGTARFEDTTTLIVDDEQRIEARAVVIATGSAPHVPDMFDSLGDCMSTSDTIFELPTLPASMAVVGGGIIGMELGQAMHRLGVRTSIFTTGDTVAGITDPHVRDVAVQLFKSELDLHTNARVESARRGGDGVVLGVHSGGKRLEHTFERVLVSTGRRPRLGALDLDKAALELGEHGVPVHDTRTMQCGDAPVFIAGDVTNERPLLHVAAEEGRISGGNAARYPDVKTRRRTTALSIVFTDPNIAIAGASFRSLDRARDLGGVDTGLPDGFETGTVSFADQGRARVFGNNHGCLRVYGNACGNLLGSEMIAPAGEHLAHLLSWAMGQRLTVEAALSMPFYHPVVEEGLRTALRDLAARLKIEIRPTPFDCDPV